MTTKTLLVMRHAKSSWDDADLADVDRPLNDRGRRDAPRMGRLLLAEGLVPDYILSSPAERAVTTASLVAEACGYSGGIETDRRLYHGHLEAFFKVIAGVDDQFGRLLVVGHNPGIEAFLSKISLQWLGMTTGNIGRVDLDLPSWSNFEEGSYGTLVSFWRPKELV